MLEENQDEQRFLEIENQLKTNEINLNAILKENLEVQCYECVLINRRLENEKGCGLGRI